MARPKCKCNCKCKCSPAKGNRYKCSGACGKMVCKECTICGGCQRSYKQCLCHIFHIGEPVICHHCRYSNNLTVAMCDWDTFLEACSWKDPSLEVHSEDQLAFWVKKAAARMEYRPTEVRPFLEDCITMEHPAMFMPQTTGFSYHFARPDGESHREFAAMTRFVAWFATAGALSELRDTLRAQMLAPEVGVISEDPHSGYTVWERVVGSTELWSTFLYACSRENRRIGMDSCWIRTALGQIGSAEDSVRQFLKDCVTYGVRIDGTFPVEGVLSDTFMQHVERARGRSIVSFRGRAALKRFIDWMQVTGVIRTAVWGLRLRDGILAHSNPRSSSSYEVLRGTGLEDHDGTGPEESSAGSMGSWECDMGDDTRDMSEDEAMTRRDKEAIEKAWEVTYGHPDIPGQDIVSRGRRRTIDDVQGRSSDQSGPDTRHPHRRQLHAFKDGTCSRQPVPNVSGHVTTRAENMEGARRQYPTQALCEVCEEPARVPYRWCDFCQNKVPWTIWHHGRCCPNNPDNQSRLETEESGLSTRDAPGPGQRTKGCKSVCKVRVGDRLCGAQCTNQATDPDGWCNWHQYRCGHSWPPTWAPAQARPQNSRFHPHSLRASPSDNSLYSDRGGIPTYPACSNFQTCGNWARGITRCCNIWMCDTCGCWCPNGGCIEA